MSDGIPDLAHACGTTGHEEVMLQQRLLVNNPVEVDEAAALELYFAAWSGSA